MAKKAHQTNVAQHYKIPLTSYTVQTANDILRKYDVKMSQQELISQLTDNDSFYKRLLRVPALGIYNESLLNECSDICDYCQDELINVIFANQNMVNASSNKSALTNKQQEELENLQERSDEINKSLGSARKDQEAVVNQYSSVVEFNVQKWKELIEESADQIIAKLEELNFTLSPNFREKLIRRLDKQGAGINFSKDALAAFHLKDKISGIEKAILSTLIEERKDVKH